MEVETVTNDSIQVVVFSLINESNKKKENYAVPVDQVREIRQIENITKVPKAKPHVKGVMNLRGMIIPVVDIKKRLGFGDAKNLENSKYRILIADVRDSVYGLIVDSVEQVMHISAKEVEPVPPDTFESFHYIKGIAKINGKLIVLLDIIALFEDSPEFTKNLPSDKGSTRKDSGVKSETSIDQPQKSSVDDDIPEELKEVLREDGEGVASSNDSL